MFHGLVYYYISKTVRVSTPRPLWGAAVLCMDINHHVFIQGPTCRLEVEFREDLLCGADQIFFVHLTTES